MYEQAQPSFPYATLRTYFHHTLILTMSGALRLLHPSRADLLHLFSAPRAAVTQIREPLESAGEEQYDEDKDHDPEKPRRAIAVRMVAKVRQRAHQEQNEDDQ
jgi:hypothetical protein